MITLPDKVQFLIGTIEDDSNDPPETRTQMLRRRTAVILTLIVGSVLLSISLSIEPGDSSFYPMTFALAAVWIIGALASGPLHLGAYPPPRGGPVQATFIGVAVGLVLGAIFVVGALVVREIPPIADFISDVLDHADQGTFSLILATALVNGIAEEMFFRGAVYTALKGHAPVIFSTLIYVIATLASGNPMLGFAAILLGAVSALERRATGGVLASMGTHVSWTIIMVFVLPTLF
jgi:membrane protease YdiL (CAAX protease family)